MFNLLKTFKFWLFAIGGLAIVSIIAGQYIVIKIKTTKIERQRDTISKQDAALKSYEVALDEKEDQIARLNKSIAKERALKKVQDTKYKRIATQLATLKRQYINVKNYLNTRVPTELNDWMRKTYSNKNKNNRKRAAKKLPERLRYAGVQRHYKRRHTRVYKSPKQIFR